MENGQTIIHKRNPWHDASLVEMVRAWWAGGRSGESIAKGISALHGERVTRSSIMGLISRRKFESPMSTKNRPNEPKRARVPRKPRVPRTELPPMEQAPMVALPAIEGAAALAFGLSKTLLELRAGDCRWPVGHDLPYAFCAATKAPGSSYCPAHSATAFRRPNSMGGRFYVR